MMDKSKKYDRQLRLWETYGQVLLERSSILVLGISATALEVLKNLILPGVGSITIQSRAKLNPSTSSSSFFLNSSLTQADYDKYAVHIAVSRLRELNEDVKCNAIVADPNEVDTSEDYLSRFNLVVIAGQATLTAEAEKKLYGVTWKRYIPVISLESTGLLGLASVTLREHPVMDPHVNNMKDFRMDRPWKELKEYERAVKPFEDMSPVEYAHTPFPVILMRMMSKYVSEHGAPPNSVSEFKEFLRGQRRPGLADPENWLEAESNAFRAMPGHTKVPEVLREQIFSQCDQKLNNCMVLDSRRKFWALGTALKAFVEERGELPLTGKLVDMKATTAEYVELQRLYSTKAQQDTRRLKQLIKEDGISEREVRSFCRNCGHVSIAVSREPAVLRASDDTSRQDSVRKGLGHWDESTRRHWAIASCMYARKIFQQRNRRVPSLGKGNDLPALRAIWREVMGEAVVTDEAGEWLKEVVRGVAVSDVVSEGGEVPETELGATAALVGGMASQEALKILTHQYVPVTATVVFDGVHSTTGVVAM